jgi:hypothetical protein
MGERQMLPVQTTRITAGDVNGRISRPDGTGGSPSA